VRSRGYRLSAVVEREPTTFELKVSVFSNQQLEKLLQEKPLTITVEPIGHPLANRLLHALRRGDSEACNRRVSGSSGRWRCYRRVLDEPAAQWVTPVEQRDMKRRVAALCSQSPGTLAAFVDEALLHDPPSAAAIEEVMSKAITASEGGALFRPAADVRRAVLDDRRALLAEIPTYSPAEIQRAFESSNCNPSQRAADLRKAQRMFGVRAGQSWRYPHFQFRDASDIYPEIQLILTELPDVTGWDRLHWFMTPHPLLNEQSPLQMWPHDRAQVVVAAQREGWRRRD
jgi:hypothetical protein